jgi:hypothetical protein
LAGQIHFHEKKEFLDWVGLARYSPEAWPDEALEGGLTRPLTKKGEKLGEGEIRQRFMLIPSDFCS